MQTRNSAIAENGATHLRNRQWRGWSPKRPVDTCYPPNLVVLSQTVRALLRKFARIIWLIASRLSRPRKVIGTDTNQSATYDFLCSIATMGLYHTVSEINNDFSLKSHISHPMYLTSPLSGSPLNRVTMDGPKKLEWRGIHECDGRTDS